MGDLLPPPQHGAGGRDGERVQCHFVGTATLRSLFPAGFVHPMPVCLAVKSTGVAPGPAVSKGEEVMHSRPGDTKGDGRNLAANEAAEWCFLV